MQEHQIIEKLKKGKFTLTKQRAAVLDVLLENPSKHLSAEEVFNLARGKIPHIGMATVYRALERFASLGILSKIMFDEGKYRYELCCDDEHQHHHIICLKCNTIIEVEEDLLQELEDHIESQGFRVVNHKLKIYAICPACRDKEHDL